MLTFLIASPQTWEDKADQHVVETLFLDIPVKGFIS